VKPSVGWRAWLAYHRDELHLARVILMLSLGIGLLVSGVLWVLRPTGPPEAVQGRVKAFGFVETKRGSMRTATVITETGPARIDLPVRFDCRPGDHIALRRRPIRFGYAYRIARVARPCSRPPLSQQFWLPISNLTGAPFVARPARETA